MARLFLFVGVIAILTALVVTFAVPYIKRLRTEYVSKYAALDKKLNAGEDDSTDKTDTQPHTDFGK